MNKKEVLQALEQARKTSKKRKFDQTFEFIINFRGVDFKKVENRIDLEVKLPIMRRKYYCERIPGHMLTNKYNLYSYKMAAIH